MIRVPICRRIQRYLDHRGPNVPIFRLQTHSGISTSIVHRCARLGAGHGPARILVAVIQAHRLLLSSLCRFNLEYGSVHVHRTICTAYSESLGVAFVGNILNGSGVPPNLQSQTSSKHMCRKQSRSSCSYEAQHPPRRILGCNSGLWSEGGICI